MGSVLVLSPRMKSFSPVCLSLFVVTTVCLASAASDNLESLSDIADVNSGISVSQRNPKLFFVSTSSTTATLNTATTCWSSAAGTAAFPNCMTGRKKRFISDQMEDFSGLSRREITPVNKLDSSLKEPESSGEREGRFLLHWITTTSISTLTSFTATNTIGITCTPAGFVLAQCG